MTFLSSLSHEDLTRYSQLVSEAIGIRRHFDLLRWLQGNVQCFVPHEIMIAAWGDFGLGIVYHDIVSALPGVRTEHAESEAISPLLRDLFNRWVEYGKTPYALDVGESGFLLKDTNLQCTLGDALQGMRTSLVHGISDERGRHDCLYITFSSSSEINPLARKAMEVLLPYLDTALRQVSHLPRQHHADDTQLPANPSAEQSKGSDNFGLSDREAEIMEWVRMGKTNAEIGNILDISSFTVKNHLQRIFKKLDVFNRIQAVSKYEQSTANA